MTHRQFVSAGAYLNALLVPVALYSAWICPFAWLTMMNLCAAAFNASLVWANWDTLLNQGRDGID